MMEVDKALHMANTADEEDLKSLVHHPSSKVISKILLNRSLSEGLVIIIANRKNVNAEILESLYNDIRWKDSYRVKLALCKNPKTPRRISLSIIKSLKIFDLADLTRNHNVPIDLRIKAEANIIEKILSLPLGIKLSIARRASSNVLVRLIVDGMKEVVIICLDSPYITEGDICKIVSMKKTTSQVIRQIANHPKWSYRYDVQWALILNNHTPLSCVVNFLKSIRTTDLKELYNLPAVPSSTRPFIYRELMDREEKGL